MIFVRLKCDLHIKNVHFTMFCIYRPPPSAKNRLTHPMFLNDFECFLDYHALTLSNFFIVGDFNFHYDALNDTYVKQFVELFEVRNLIQLVTTPTHKAGHTIDWIVTRSFIPIFNIEVFDQCISDHFLISFQFDCKKPKREIKSILSRNMKSISNETTEIN